MTVGKAAPPRVGRLPGRPTPVRDRWPAVSTPTTIPMKLPIFPLVSGTALAIAMSLGSCIVPTDGYQGSSTTITTYQPGRRIDSLPGGYRTETISGVSYYYHDGYYYRSDSGGYVVVEPPRTSRYYSDYDRHHHAQHRDMADHRDYRRPGGSQIEEVRTVTRLPDGYRVINRDGVQYYQAGDRYYRREGGGYVIVDRP